MTLVSLFVVQTAVALVSVKYVVSLTILRIHY